MPYNERQPKRPIKSLPARLTLLAIGIIFGVNAAACNRTPPPPPEPVPSPSSEWGCATITETGGDDFDQKTAGNAYAGAINVADANQINHKAASFDLWVRANNYGLSFLTERNLTLEDLKEVKKPKSLGTLIQVCLSGFKPTSNK